MASPWILALFLPAALLMYWRLQGAPHDRRAVGSLELWRAVQEKISTARRHRRPSLEFILEAGLLAIMILALAGPSWQGDKAADATLQTRVIVDAGAAMKTPTRRAEVESILRARGLENAPRSALPESAEKSLATSATRWEPLLAREARGDGDILFLVDAIEDDDRLPPGVSCQIVGRKFSNSGWIAAELRQGPGDRHRLFAAAAQVGSEKGEGRRYELRQGEKEIASGLLSFNNEGRAEIDLSLAAIARDRPLDLVLSSGPSASADEIAADDRLRFHPPSGRARISLPQGTDFDLLADALDALGRRVLRGSLPRGSGFEGLSVRRLALDDSPGEGTPAGWIFPPTAAPRGEVLEGWIEPVSPRLDDLGGSSLRARKAEALELREGDEVMLAVRGQAVLLRRAQTLIWGIDPSREDWDRNLAFLRLVSAMLRLDDPLGSRLGPGDFEGAGMRWTLEAELLDEGETRGRAGPGTDFSAPSRKASREDRPLLPVLMVLAGLALATLVTVRRRAVAPA